MARWVSAEELNETLKAKLDEIGSDFDFVTGPGRSGAVASVIASHYLGIPFLPYGTKVSGKPRVLVVDTAMQSGRTIRKACRRYETDDFVFAFNEPPRVKFWYEKKND